ncbi:MAG: hypothetical protein IPJ82_21105 [Lewinellaceae bacterium]|nr:hypothetical protein [Lewinellaceae bacterium]
MRIFCIFLFAPGRSAIFARNLPQNGCENKVNPKTLPQKVPASTPRRQPLRQTPPQLTDTFRPGFWQEQWMPALALVVLAFVL